MRAKWALVVGAQRGALDAMAGCVSHQAVVRPHLIQMGVRDWVIAEEAEEGVAEGGAVLSHDVEDLHEVGCAKRDIVSFIWCHRRSARMPRGIAVWHALSRRMMLSIAQRTECWHALESSTGMRTILLVVDTVADMVRGTVLAAAGRGLLTAFLRRQTDPRRRQDTVSAATSVPQAASTTTRGHCEWRLPDDPNAPIRVRESHLILHASHESGSEARCRKPQACRVPER